MLYMGFFPNLLADNDLGFHSRKKIINVLLDEFRNLQEPQNHLDLHQGYVRFFIRFCPHIIEQIEEIPVCLPFGVKTTSRHCDFLKDKTPPKEIAPFSIFVLISGKQTIGGVKVG